MPQLKVIRASAGSGKTYLLANEYLRLLFADPDNFRHILAVTFTNKATNEMKSRIVRELYLLKSGKPTTLLEDLMNHTGFPEKQVRLKADDILKKILHQYSGFSVNTIDSFFQRIIRAFTRELGLQGTYSIELDTESLLTSVIDQLLVKAETDKSLLSWLGNYAESLIEKGESWNFRKSIRSLGKEIFREEFKSLPDQFIWQYGNRDSLRHFQQDLYSRFRIIEKEYRSFGELASSMLEKSGLTVDDFSMRSRGPAGFLVKLASGEFREPTATAGQAATNPEKWYTRHALRSGEIAVLAERELIPLMQQVLDYYETHYRRYFTLEVVLKNIYTLGILADLSHLAYQWCNDNNAFLLPEAPGFLQKIIDGNDTPFIYEKAGYWYHHFMIDEFQDTSLMQWLNFKPLISNSLSQNFDNLVVGDVKQSIYRWRNSNWTILSSGLEKDFNSGIMESRTLDRNWRSGKNIIEFNNRFFRHAASVLDREFALTLESDGYDAGKFENDPVTHLYSDTSQKPGHESRPGGIVQIRFVKDEGEDDYYDRINRNLVLLLYELLEKGYSAGDIAIITRKNKEAKLLADFLLTWHHENPDLHRHFDVISDEALRLGSSPVVVFLASLLQYIVDPGDQISSYFILFFFKNHLPGNKNAGLLPAHDAASREKELAELLPAGFFELAGSAGSLSLSEIVERLISIFGLARFKGEQVYLDAFRDLIQEYGQKQMADPFRFLEYWNETGREKSVSAPAGQDAVRIITIHKSKGLEFNIVIIPYCNWELNPMHNTILWCRSDDELNNMTGTLPVNYSGKLKKTYFAGNYYQELLNQYIDNLNLLYVAFTRARQGLYVFCKQEKDDALKSVSGLAGNVMIRIMENNPDENIAAGLAGIMDASGTCHTFGDLPTKEQSVPDMPEDLLIPSNVPVETAAGRIKIAYPGRIFIDPAVNQPKRPLNEGKILHEIFKSIRTREDIDSAITGLYLHGKINLAEKEKYLNQISFLMNDIQVISWFAGDWQILTEAEIILPAGLSKRPDRVMTKGDLTLVIDYKFGEKKDNSYRLQVNQYISLLRQMGYSRIEGYLWYVMLGIIEKV